MSRETPTTGGGDTPIQTTQTSLRVIESIYRNEGARLAELVDELGLAKSTVYAHLQTLRDMRYVVREGNVYHLGLKFTELGESAMNRRKGLYDDARAYTDELSQETDGVADFSVEEHGRLISLFSDLYHRRETVGLNGQRTFYMHNTAAGKAILAALDYQRVRAIVSRWGLPAETENTITGRAELFDELRTTRRRGYAVNDNEAVRGLYSVSKAVRFPDGSVWGAFSIDVPSYRVSDELVHSLAESLDAAVDRFESDIRG